MKWTTAKVVVAENGSMILGCIVGPFDSEEAAQAYADKAIIGSLGYEKWLVRELQFPDPI